MAKPELIAQFGLFIGEINYMENKISKNQKDSRSAFVAKAKLFILDTLYVCIIHIGP